MENYLRFCLGESTGEIIGKRNNATVETIMNYNSEELEKKHDFIQWVFPTYRYSKFNSSAPILTREEISRIKNNPGVQLILTNFAIKFSEYWGLVPYDRKKLILLNGHNGLRLSRMIECLTLFGFDLNEILEAIQQGIDDEILNPEYEMYENERIPIWFVRYLEN